MHAVAAAPGLPCSRNDKLSRPLTVAAPAANLQREFSSKLIYLSGSAAASPAILVKLLSTIRTRFVQLKSVLDAGIHPRHVMRIRQYSRCSFEQLYALRAGNELNR